MKKKKVAILGGGVGAVTTAFALTSREDWQSHYDITLYQMGFRLGGKGASGRNPAHFERIEEHGLHIWLGFYENAFRLMRACYDELGRAPTAKLAKIEQAFKKQSFISLEETVDGRFETWSLPFPTNGDVPGTGGAIPRPRDYLAMMLELAVELITGTELDLHFVRGKNRDSDRVFSLVSMLPAGIVSMADRNLSSSGLLRLLAAFVRLVMDGAADLAKVALAPAIALVDLLVDLFVRPNQRAIEDDRDLRRLVVMLDIVRVVFKGIVQDELLVHGFAKVNDEEFTAWFRRHGALEMTVQSAPIRAWYDLVFGFPGGDYGQPGNVEAGTSLNAFLRLALTYKGAIFWEMQAGMGDTIFAPYYEVLKRRGVRFEFFHKVKNLGLDTSGKHVETIDFDIQATLATGVVAYEPLVDVKGLPCWPSVPRYELLAQGTELRTRRIDLESSWSDWKPVDTKHLRRGHEFDEVVLGISVAALNDIASSLIEQDTKFATMVSSLETVQTMALQLWFTPDLAGLGWKEEKTVMTSYADAFNTWADMSHLIDRESWPAEHSPFNIAYFCGPMPDADVIPPYSDHAFPGRERRRVEDEAERWLSQWTGHLFPNVVPEGMPRALDYAYLVDPAGGTGKARLLSQYFRANIDKSERYVLSVTGSSVHRLHPGRSGFANLFLAGDWTRCGIDAGCVEAATISGLLCAEALSGVYETIAGHYDVERIVGTRSESRGTLDGDPARPTNDAGDETWN